MRSKIIFDGKYLIYENGNIYALFIYNKYSGHVKRKSPLLLKSYTTEKGYLRVQLGKYGQHSVHRLVAEAFIDGFTRNHQINHIDGNKINNNLNNLELSNGSHNCLHAYHSLGRTKFNKVNNKILNDMLDMWADGKPYTKIADKFNVTPNAVGALFKNRLKNKGSKLYEGQYLRILMGYSKSKNSKYRHFAKEELIKLGVPNE